MASVQDDPASERRPEPLVAEESWPAAYAPPTIEPLGTVWERAGSGGSGSSDSLTDNSP